MRGTAALWALTALSGLQQAAAVLPDMKLPDCVTGQKFDQLPDKGGFWGYSGAEQFADEYIKLNTDHSNWTQNLYMELFPDATHTDFVCLTTGSNCRIVQKCEDFNKLGLGGLHYLFISLMNFHGFMAELRQRFDEVIQLTGNEIESIREDLMITNEDVSRVTKLNKQRADVGTLFMGAMSMGSALSGVAAETLTEAAAGAAGIAFESLAAVAALLEGGAFILAVGTAVMVMSNAMDGLMHPASVQPLVHDVTRLLTTS
jgi:hypothetical protein